MVSMRENVGSLLLLSLVALQGVNDVACSTRGGNKYETYVASGRTTRHGRSTGDRPDTVVQYDIAGSTGGGKTGMSKGWKAVIVFVVLFVIAAIIGSVLQVTTGVFTGINSPKKDLGAVSGIDHGGDNSNNPVIEVKTDNTKYYKKFESVFLGGGYGEISSEYKQCIDAAILIMTATFKAMAELTTFNGRLIRQMEDIYTPLKVLMKSEDDCDIMGFSTEKVKTEAGGYYLSITSDARHKWARVFPPSDVPDRRSERDVSLGNTKSTSGMQKRRKRNYHLHKYE